MRVVRYKVVSRWIYNAYTELGDLDLDDDTIQSAPNTEPEQQSRHQHQLPSFQPSLASETTPTSRERKLKQLKQQPQIQSSNGDSSDAAFQGNINDSASPISPQSDLE